MKFQLETTKKIPDMTSEELSKFPNHTYWGSVRSQEIKLMNIGIEHNPKLVIYNRVPKCGSTTTLDIIRFLKKKLHFNVYNDIAPHMTVRFNCYSYTSEKLGEDDTLNVVFQSLTDIIFSIMLTMTSKKWN